MNYKSCDLEKQTGNIQLVDFYTKTSELAPKWVRFVPYEANLTEFGANPDLFAFISDITNVMSLITTSGDILSMICLRLYRQIASTINSIWSQVKDKSKKINKVGLQCLKVKLHR